ncbi:MAG: tRNA adenosine(34) deaminase TadA [Bacillota bacterium]
MKVTEQIYKDIQYMKVALLEGEKAFLQDEVPIGAVMVRDDVIISRAYNLRNTKKNPLRHAEIDIISESAEIVGDWRLEDCTLYVTVEPCPMCAGAIVQARIPRIVYGTASPKAGACGSILNIVGEPKLNHRVEVLSGVLEEDCMALMQRFFVNCRKS